MTNRYYLGSSQIILNIPHSVRHTGLGYAWHKTIAIYGGYGSMPYYPPLMGRGVIYTDSQHDSPNLYIYLIVFGHFCPNLTRTLPIYSVFLSFTPSYIALIAISLSKAKKGIFLGVSCAFGHIFNLIGNFLFLIHRLVYTPYMASPPIGYDAGLTRWGHATTLSQENGQRIS